ncbi:hypothetical protein [Nonomuraea jiangxiensis]|uniref:Secreted protein n=1 Tax=Nonomuraea jiangxiensis TaxID=633440 RepID=A0A1G7ZVE7_9ACTN|nr:hypothetical protein [Nonomuraea jiangxiensis]SDH12586.1 hypothetical protein SAMN05421869_101535 [Nonomuraea jiangxiensis]
MKYLRPESAATSVLAMAVVTAFALVTAGPAAARDDRGSECLDSGVPLSVEESRLVSTLPDNADPSVPQSRSFARQMIEGGGFQDFAPALTRDLCRTRSLKAATALVRQKGEALWKDAVRRAQRPNHVEGDLPYSDDRPLYWTRLESTAALRQWTPGFRLSGTDRTELITTFDRASRGMFDIDLPSGKGVKRVIVSGFDPYTLDGGTTGTASGTVGNNIRHGNPSGATALALDGTTYRTKSGKLARIEAYTLPVSYPEFQRGYLEDTVGPFMRPGPRQVDASITVSQAGGAVFNLEQWNGRYHGVSLGNDNFRPCPAVNGVPQLAVNNNGCNATVVERWGGPGQFSLTNPPQWTSATLPIAEMIQANTGASIPRPPGDTWPDPSVAFGVVWHTNYTEFPDCASTARVTRNSPPPTEFPPPTAPVPPSAGSCSYSGGGGNYLSNESAYRNTLLRDRMGLDIPAGHIHTPDMQHFETDFNPSDATFDAWRLAIVGQGRNLIHVVADTA